MRNSLSGKISKQSRLFALFGLLMLAILAGCKKENIPIQPSPSPPVIRQGGEASSLNTLAGENIIFNGNFTEWDSVQHSPGSWILQTSNGDTAVISQTEKGLKFERNAAGSFYLYQKVLLEKNNFFKVSVTVDYTINNYYPCGIYAIDSSRNKVLAKFERFNSSGKETWEFVFYARREMEVTIAIGFLNGINARATFSDVSLAKYTYQPEISNSDFAAYLNNKLNLTFTHDTYDSSINKLADYLNGVLLSKNMYQAYTAELPVINNMIGTNENYVYFNQYLNNLDEITDAYCQKVSLSLDEILTNEFSIPVRQIHVQMGGTGVHQFLEYWNPFARNWIIIDPYFNCRYLRDNKLLGIDDLDNATAANYLSRFGANYFYQTTDELSWLWETMDELIVSDYYSLTFPH